MNPEHIEKIRNIVNYVCIAQFVVIVIFVQVFCRPLTKTDVGLVGASGVLGLLVSGFSFVYFQELKKSIRKRNLEQEVKSVLTELNKKEQTPGHE